MFTEEYERRAPEWTYDDPLGAGTPTYHVALGHPSDVVSPRCCLACGRGDDVLIRRVATRSAAPGVHFFTWAGRPLRLPMCGPCDLRLRRHLELPLLIWFFALPAAVGIMGWALARGALPMPGLVLTSLIAIPVCVVRCWLNRQPPVFEVTDYGDCIDFAWTDHGRAVEFAELNHSEMVRCCDGQMQLHRE